MMTRTHRSPAEATYSPMYFLASLGAGGLAVTFFMYLMFWVPHPGQTVPVFEDLAAFAATASPLGQAMLGLAVAAIALLSVVHLALLVWNFRNLSRFKSGPAYKALHTGNAETQMKAVPLTLAMSINVGFILGLVFVPGLWSVVEYLFPLAIIAFVAVGLYAFALLSRFLGRVLTGGGFDPQANNSFAQMLPAFALAMVGVGLAAPAGMSATPWIVTVALVLSTFFVVAAVLVTLVALILAVLPMVQHGTAPEAAPTLMVLVPIVTVISIAMMRIDHGLHTTFEVHSSAAETLVFLTRMLSVQVLFGLLGLLVLRRQDYARRFLATDGKPSVGSFALICPGVALSIMVQFWVNKGLVAAGVIDKFGAAYWIASAPALILQVVTILLFVRLVRQHFGAARVAPAHAHPAE
jgi:hypothetical protein